MDDEDEWMGGWRPEYLCGGAFGVWALVTWCEWAEIHLSLGASALVGVIKLVMGIDGRIGFRSHSVSGTWRAVGGWVHQGIERWNNG